MKFLPLIWSNLKRKKLRTMLTLFCILVAFILYGMLAAIKAAARSTAALSATARPSMRGGASSAVPASI